MKIRPVARSTSWDNPPTDNMAALQNQQPEVQEDSQLELWKGGSIGPDFNDDDPMFMTDKFRMYCYKVLPCSKRFCHDWSTCPFAHFSERAKRRDPRNAKYTAIACPEMKKQGEPCPRGDKCPYSHNTFEYWLHPTRYRTRLCRDGEACSRKVCFFAHKPEDVRTPPCRPSLPVADDCWPVSDDSGDCAFEAPFGSEPAAKSPAHHRRSTSSPTDGGRGLSGRLSHMLKKIPSRQLSDGFHQPSSQDLGSTFFEKVLESIKEGNMQSNSNMSSNHEEMPTTAPAQNVTTAQLGEAVTNLLSNLCLQNQPIPAAAPAPAPANQPNPVLEALVNQISAASATPALPEHSMMQGTPGLNAPLPNVQAGIPMPYYPVANGALPPGMSPYHGPEAVSGYMSTVPVGAPPGVPVSPFNGMNNMLVPDTITSAYGAMNLVPNGTNMNDLIQTILNLQTQGYHQPYGTPYANASGFPVPYHSLPPQPMQVSGAMSHMEPMLNEAMMQSQNSLKKAESNASDGLMYYQKSPVTCVGGQDGNIEQKASGALGNSTQESGQDSPPAPGFSLPNGRRRSVSGIV